MNAIDSHAPSATICFHTTSSVSRMCIAEYAKGLLGMDVQINLATNAREEDHIILSADDYCYVEDAERDLVEYINGFDNAKVMTLEPCEVTSTSPRP